MVGQTNINTYRVSELINQYIKVEKIKVNLLKTAEIQDTIKEHTYIFRT